MKPYFQQNNKKFSKTLSNNQPAIHILSVLSEDVDVIPCFESRKICVPTMFQNVPYLQIETVKDITKQAKVVNEKVCNIDHL